MSRMVSLPFFSTSKKQNGFSVMNGYNDKIIYFSNVNELYSDFFEKIENGYEIRLYNLICPVGCNLFCSFLKNNSTHSLQNRKILQLIKKDKITFLRILFILSVPKFGEKIFLGLSNKIYALKLKDTSLVENLLKCKKIISLFNYHK